LCLTCCCLGSDGNGVSVEEGCESGPGPLERGKDKQLMSNDGRDNMGKDEEEQSSHDMMKEDCHEQSEQSSDQVKCCKRDC
jgi:hypothetical protein